MASRSAKQAIIKRILNSNEFSNSHIYSALLKYLVDCSLEGVIPKEYTVGVDVFGKDKNFDPTIDSTVRAHIHNLRHKLEHYYLTEGKEDKIKISISKGRYVVNFIENKIPEPGNKRQLIKNIFYVLLLICIIVIIIFYRQIYFLRNPEWLIPKDDPVWSDYFKNEGAVSLVFSGYFFFLEYRKEFGKYWITRDQSINSVDEFNAFILDTARNKRRFIIPPFSFTSTNSIQCFLYFYHVFENTGKKIDIRFTSKLSWKDIISQDIVYVGSYKTLGILDYIFSKTNFIYDIQPDIVKCISGDGDTLIYEVKATPSQKYLRDYAVAAKLPGPGGHPILLLCAFHNIGMTELVKQFTDPTLLVGLERQLSKKGEIPQFFEILFRVNGLERMGFDVEMIYFREINEEHIKYEFDFLPLP